MNLFVGNLPFKIDETELRTRFASYGTVATCRIITDPTDGRSKGFGFVEMPDDEHARRAIAGLNGTNLMGRDIVVNEAKPREPRRRSGG